MAARKTPRLDVSSSLDGWDVAETGESMLSGWDDESGLEPAAVVKPARNTKPKTSRRKTADNETASRRPRRHRLGAESGLPIEDNAADSLGSTGQETGDASIAVSLAADESGSPQSRVLDDGDTVSGLGPVTEDSPWGSEPRGGDHSDDGLIDLDGDYDATPRTGDHGTVGNAGSHELTATVDEDDLLDLDDSSDSLQADSPADGHADEDGLIADGDDDSRRSDSRGVADGRSVKTDSDQLLGDDGLIIDDPETDNSVPSGDDLIEDGGQYSASTAGSGHFSEPSAHTGKTGGVNKPIPVGEPEPTAGPSSDDGLMMFLGDEGDYALEQSLRSKTMAEAAARNALRLHRPSSRARRPRMSASAAGAMIGAAAGYSAAAAGIRGQKADDGGAAPVNDPVMRGDEAVRGEPMSAPTSQPTVASQQSRPFMEDQPIDDGPFLDYDDLLNDMNAGDNSDYIDVDSPAVIDDEDSLNGEGSDEITEDAHEVEPVQASRPALLSKSTSKTASAGGADDQSIEESSTGETGEDDKGDGLDSKEKPSLRDRFNAFLAQARSEIGAGDDDDGADSEPAVKKQKKPRRSKSVGAPSGDDGRGDGPKSLLKDPIGFVRGAASKIRAVKRGYRIAVAVSVLVAGLWTALNIPAAMDKGGATGEAVDEGSVEVSDARWTGSTVELTLSNDSEMIAHVSGSASVKSWSPTVSPLTWLGARETATCKLPVVDVDPGASKKVEASECSGKPTGVWPRVKATLSYE